jgi:hypothetical protein
VTHYAISQDKANKLLLATGSQLTRAMNTGELVLLGYDGKELLRTDDWDVFIEAPTRRALFRTIGRVHFNPARGSE